MAMGQVAFLFVDVGDVAGRSTLAALDTGLWLMPSGVAIVDRLAARQLADSAHRNHQRGARRAVPRGDRTGATVPSPHPDAHLPGAAPRASRWSASASDSPARNSTTSSSPTYRPETSGAASGANTTVRMIGASLGISVISALLSDADDPPRSRRSRSAGVTPPGVRAAVITQIHTSGVNFAPQQGTTLANVQTLRVAIDHAVISGARTPLIFAAIVVYIAAALSFFIPQVGPRGSRQGDAAGRRARVRDARVRARSRDRRNPVTPRAKSGRPQPCTAPLSTSSTISSATSRRDRLPGDEQPVVERADQRVDEHCGIDVRRRARPRHRAVDHRRHRAVPRLDEPFTQRRGERVVARRVTEQIRNQGSVHPASTGRRRIWRRYGEQSSTERAGIGNRMLGERGVERRR